MKSYNKCNMLFLVSLFVWLLVVIHSAEADESRILQTLTYNGERDIHTSFGSLEVTLTKEQETQSHGWVPVAEGFVGGKNVFSVRFTNSPSESVRSTFSSIRLDDSQAGPQYIFEYFAGGVDCCFKLKVITSLPSGDWGVVDLGESDSDIVFEHRDLTSDTVIVLNDQNFQSNFRRYNLFWSGPPRVLKLKGAELIDVTRRIEYKGILQSSNDARTRAMSDAAWQDEESVAGWVVTRAQLGDVRDAWQRMITKYDVKIGGKLTRCEVNVPIAQCSSKDLQQVTFPEALREYLYENHFVGTLEDLPLPAPAPSREPNSAALQPQPQPQPQPLPQPLPQPVVAAEDGPSLALQQCIDALDTVKTLVVQMFLNRRLRANEKYDVVTFDEDTTADSFDATTRKLTCDVTYNVDLKAFIGNLASNGELNKASGLFNLMKRVGPKASKSIKFSLKPTATKGQSLVELLR